MNILLPILIIVGALATLAVLVRGVVLMASGKPDTGQQQNKLMMQRVMLQGITIVCVVIFLLVMSSGK